MSETKADIRAQLAYMRKHKSVYLAKSNPARITLAEFNRRIKALKDSL